MLRDRVGFCGMVAILLLPATKAAILAAKKIRIITQTAKCHGYGEDALLLPLTFSPKFSNEINRRIYACNSWMICY